MKPEKKINEELTKGDKDEIKKLARAEFESQFDRKVNQKKFEELLSDNIKKHLGTKKIKKEVAEISKEVVSNLFRTLWQKRNFWNDIDNV